MTEQEQKVERMRAYVADFIAANDDYFPTDHNRQAMLAYLDQHNLELTRETLQEAFESLKFEGKLDIHDDNIPPEETVGPTAQPEPPIIRRGDLESPAQVARMRAEQAAREIAAKKEEAQRAAEAARIEAAREAQKKVPPIGYASGADVGAGLADQQRARRQAPQGLIPRNRQVLIEAGERRAEEMRREARRTRRHL